MTSRGFDEAAMDVIADIIDVAISNRKDATILQGCKAKVLELCASYPLYE